MPKFSYTVTVETDDKGHANQVMVERLGPDEDYGFDYTVDWDGWPMEDQEMWETVLMAMDKYIEDNPLKFDDGQMALLEQARDKLGQVEEELADRLSKESGWE